MKTQNRRLNLRFISSLFLIFVIFFLVPVTGLAQISITAGPDHVCTAETGVVYSATPGTSTYTWTISSGGTIATGQGTSAVTVDWGEISQTAILSVVATGGSVVGTASITVTVNERPLPEINGTEPICQGTTGIVYFTEPGMTGYTWNITPYTPYATGPVANAITVDWPVAGTFTITANYTNASGCQALPAANKVIAVNQAAAPAVTSGPGTACTGTTVTYTTAASKNNYLWTVSSGGTIMSGTGTSAISVNWFAIGTHTITVTYTEPGTNCWALSPGVKSVLVSESPVPVVFGADTVCSNGTYTYWTYPGKSLYTWTPGAGATILSGGGTSTVTVRFTQAGNSTVSVNYTDPSSGCTGLNAETKNVKVIQSPSVNTISNQTHCHGRQVPFTPVSGPVPGTIYYWSNDRPSIGLPESGTGNISPFTASNTTTLPVMGTVTIQPVANGCTGATTTYTITVNPKPDVESEASQVVCNGSTTEAVVFSGSVAGTVFQWSNSRPSIGIRAEGVDSIPSFAAVNTGTVTVSAVITVTPVYSNEGVSCSGTPMTFTITVKPSPSVTPISDQVHCHNDEVPATPVSGPVSGTYFAWSNNNPLIGLAGSGTGDILPFTASNTTTAPVKGIVTITSAANGCPGSTRTYTVTVNPVPDVDAEQNQMVCHGYPTNAIVFSGTVTGTVYQWSNSQPSIGLDPQGSGNISSFTAVNTGTVTVSAVITVTPVYSNGGISCSGDPMTFTITVTPQLQAGSLTASQTVCHGLAPELLTTTALSGGVPPYLYDWEVSANGTEFTAIGGASSMTYQPGPVTADQWYRVRQTSSGGCGSAYTNPVKISVSALPVPVIEGPAAACMNATNNVYGTAGGMTNYQWGVVGGIITAGGTSTSTTVTVTWNTLGSQQVTLNYTTADGCTALTPATKTVTVQNIIIPTIDGPNPACTMGQSEYTTESGMLSYTWALPLGGGTIFSGQGTSRILVIWSTPGNRSVSVIYNDPLGCTTLTPTVIPITVNTSPNPHITGTTPICQGSAGVVYFTEEGMTGYTWSVTGGTITGGGNTSAISVTWNTAGTQTVTVNYTNPVGCQAPAAAFTRVTVQSAATPTITGPTTACTGTTTYYTTQPGMTLYNWSLLSGGTISSGAGTNSIGVTWASTGTHTVTVTYLNALGCPTLIPGAFGVTVNQSPQPTISGADTVCLNGTVTYTTEPGMALYNWTVGAGGIITSGAGTSSITVKWTQAGARAVTVNYTNPAGGCQAVNATVKNITVYSLPVPVISGPNFGCALGAGNTFSTEPGMTNYVWSVSTGGTVSPTIGTNTVTASWSTAGLQTIYVSYTDTHGCSSSAPSSYNITINARPANPVINGPAGACAGSVVAYSTVAGMTTYSWIVSSGGTILTSPSNHASTIQVQWNTPGEQTVGVNYTNISGCDALTPGTLTTTVYQLPVVNAVENQMVCNGSPTAAVTFSGTGTSYSWTNNQPTIGLPANGTGNIGTFTATNTGSTSVTALITVTPLKDNSGVLCSGATKTFTITVSPTPTVNTVSNQVVCNGLYTNAVSFSGQVEEANYEWTNSNPDIGLAQSGVGNIRAFQAINLSTIPVTATITVTPVIISMSNDGHPCVGTPTVTYGNKLYNTVQIGDQCWLKENLNIGTRIDGSNEQTDNNIPEKYCYDNLETNCDVYGGLYQWAETVQYLNGASNTAMWNPVPEGNVQGLCPAGWHIPSKDEWDLLMGYLGGENNAGGRMKESGISHWAAPNTGATNTSGFTALPGGFNGLSNSNGSPMRQFSALNYGMFFWTGTAFDNGGSWYRFNYNESNIVGSWIESTGSGLSVRCLKDNYTPGLRTTGGNSGVGSDASGIESTTESTVDSFTSGVLTCTGTPVTFTIKVNPTPVVNPVANQLLCHGALTNAINFTGTATSYSWTNTQPSIGLPASGTGNIGSFIVQNNGSVSVSAIIVVTPRYTNAGVTCDGNPVTFSIKVMPNPTVNGIANQQLCNGNQTNAINFTGSVTGAVYNWSNSQPSIGLPLSGVGSINSFTAINNGTTPVTATITMIPSIANHDGLPCSGTPTVDYGGKTYNTVQIGEQCWLKENLNIGTRIDGIQDQHNNGIIEKYCFNNLESNCDVYGGLYQWNEMMQYVSDEGTQGICPAGWHIPTGEEYSVLEVYLGFEHAGGMMKESGYSHWRAPNVSATNESGFTGLPGSGRGQGIFWDLLSYRGMFWTSSTFNDTLKIMRFLESGYGSLWSDVYKPSVGLSVRCLKDINVTSSVIGSGGTLQDAGNDGSSSGYMIDSVQMNGIGNGSDASMAGGINCTGNPVTFTITVYPTPVVNPVSSQTVCHGGTTQAVTFTGTGTTYSWTNSNPTIGLAGSGNGNILPFTATNTGIVPATATITVTPVSVDGNVTCSGQPVTFNFLVYPQILAGAATASQSVCFNTAPVALTATPPTGGTSVYSYLWQVSTDNIMFNDIAGATGMTYQPGTLTATTWYRQSQTSSDGCGTVYTNAAKISILPLPVPIISGAGAACINSTNNIYSTQTGMNGYSWSVTGGVITGPANNSSVHITWNTAGIQTVSVTYTDLNNCVAAVPGTKTVSVQSTIVPSITGPDPACTSVPCTYSTETGMLNYVWTLPLGGGTIMSGQGSSQITVMWNTAGSRNVGVIYNDALGCTVTIPTVKPVTVNASPTPSITGLGSICQGSAGVVYFTESGMAGYTWSVTGGTITSGGGTSAISVTWTTAGTQSVTVNYSNLAGCTAPQATLLPVTVQPAATPLISGPTPVCTGTTTYYTTASGMSNYTWNLDAGGTIISGSGTNTIGIRWSSIGTFNISIAYLNAQGCPTLVPGNKSVQVNQSPLPVITGADTVCLDGTLVFSTDPGMAMYTWSVSSGGLITSGQGTNMISVKWIQSGPGTVTVNYINPVGGCQAVTPTVKNITVYAPPVPVISGPQYSCTGGPGADFYTAAGMTGYTWTASPDGVISAGSGTNSVTVLWNTAGLQSVYVVFTDQHGCTAKTPSQFNLAINARPTNPVITGPAVACNGTQATYSTQPGMTLYQWTVSNGGTIITSPSNHSSTIDVLWHTSGPQSVVVTYQNTAGCYATLPGTLSVTVNPLPVPIITGPASTCNGVMGNTFTTMAGQTGYSWTVSPDGTITAGGTPVNNFVTVTWNSTSIKQVGVNYTTPEGCTAAHAATYTVTVNALPVPIITGASTGCQNTTGNVYVTEPGMTSYFWTVTSEGVITSGQGTRTVTITWLNSGNPIITVNYLNSNGCQAAIATPFMVTVNPAPSPTITSFSDPSDIVCQNTGGHIYFTEPGMSSYSWTVSGPAGTQILSGGSQSTCNLYWGGPGPTTGTLRVSVTNANGCSATSALKTVNITQPVVVGTSIVVSQNPVLTGTPVTFTASTVNGGNNPVYQWRVNGIITGTNSPTFTYVPSEGDSVICKVTSNHFCVTNPQATSNTIVMGILYGVSCPGIPTVTYQGKTYHTVQIGTQCWFKENLDAGTRINGNQEQVQNGVLEKYCYQDLESNCSVYGGLYQWNEMMQYLIIPGVQGICPQGWHIPSDEEWSVLTTYLSGESIAGGKMKEVGTSHWLSPNTGAVNTSGFTGLGGGLRFTDGTFGSLKEFGYFYASTQNSATNAWTRYLTSSLNAVGRNPNHKTLGLSVRCLKDTCSSYPPVSVSVSPSANPVCAGTSVTFTAHPVNGGQNPVYQWKVNGVNAGSNNPVFSYVPAVNDVVTCVLTSSLPSPCLSGNPATSVPVAMVVYPLPVPLLTGPVNVCPGVGGMVYNTDPGMTGYSWAVSAGGTITGGLHTNAINVTWNTAGVQTVTVSYVDQHGCVPATPSVKTVYVNQPVVPTISGPWQVCMNQTVAYSTETGMSLYNWSVGSGGIITSGIGTAVILVRWTQSGFRTVTVNYANPQTGCQALTPVVFPVTVNPLPAPVITGPTTVCEGSTGVIYFTDPGMSNYNWVISPGGIITAGNGTRTITVSWITPGTQTLTVNYTNTLGCQASTQTVKNVWVSSYPVPSIQGSSQPCTAGVFNYNTEPGMSQYNWSVSPGGTILSGEHTYSVFVRWNTTGSQSMEVNYVDAQGCFNPVPTIKPITVLSPPVPSISGASSPCTSSGEVYVTESGMSNYQWTVLPGGVITGGQGTHAVTVLWQTPGFSGMTVNYTTPGGCRAEFPTAKTVTVLPTPIPVISGLSEITVGSTTTYTTDAGMIGYQWSVSVGGTIVGGAGTNTIQVNWHTTGNQTVNLDVINTSGCHSVSPTVYPVRVLPPSLVMVQNITVGAGQSMCYDAVQTIVVAGSGTHFIVQSGGSATFIAGQNIMILPGTTVQNGGFLHGYITTNGMYCGMSMPSIVTVPTAVEPPATEVPLNKFKVYPNPNPGIFYVECPGERVNIDSRIDIYSMKGERIFTSELREGITHKVSIEGRPTGIYILRIISGDQVQTFRIVKQ